MNRHVIVEHRASVLLALSLVAATTLATACEREDGAATRALPESRAASVSDRVASMPLDDGRVHRDSQIVHILITANTGEVDQGMLAQGRASNEAVAGFATMMIVDHGAANARVQALAQEKGIVPEDNAVSEALTSDGERTASRLQSLSGPEFDEAYMDAQIAGHVKVLEIIDNELIPAARDPDLKQLLASLRETVADHLEHARQIRGELGPAVLPDDGSAIGSHHRADEADHPW